MLLRVGEWSEAQALESREPRLNDTSLKKMVRDWAATPTKTCIGEILQNELIYSNNIFIRVRRTPTLAYVKNNANRVKVVEVEREAARNYRAANQKPTSYACL